MHVCVSVGWLFYDPSRIHNIHCQAVILLVKEFCLPPFTVCCVTGLFPQLDHQKRVIAKSLSRQSWPPRSTSHSKSSKSHSDRDRHPPSKERSKTSSSQLEKKSPKDHRSYSREMQATSENRSESIPSSEVPTNKE
jgi:hypothetical protein